MTDVTGAAAPALPGLFARVVGIITAPKAMYEKIVPTPRILAVLAFCAFVMGASQAAFLATERGQQAYVDFQMQQQEKGMKAFGITRTQEQMDLGYQQMQKMAPYQKYLVFVQFFVGLPVILLIASGIYFVAFNVVMGGTASYRQVMAVVAHSSVIGSLGFLFAMAIAFGKGAMSTSPANLGLLLPMLPDGSFLGSFLGAIVLFRLWEVAVTAIGLGVLYKRSGRNIAITLISIWFFFVAIYAYFVSR